MSIEIKLDSAALSALIENNDEFRLQLQSSVLANVASRYIKGVNDVTLAAVKAQVTAETRGLLGILGTFNYNQFCLNEATKKTIKDKVQEHVTSTLNKILEAELSRESLDERVNAAIAARMSKTLVDIDTRVASQMRSYTNTKVKEMVEAKFESAMTAINE